MSYLIQGESGGWEVIIGLEAHAQIISKAKLFSGASAAFGGEPNSQVSLVDAAMPGMLPVINEVCIEQAVRTGLGLGAKINLHSTFDRKNYFYADLPQGYQISQLYRPIAGEGFIDIDLADGQTRKIGIERLHIEQDAGKSLHDQDNTRTFVDLNRAGVGLMEIVSKPDLRSPEEAGAYLTKLRAIMRYLGSCDGNMAEGSLRADANVSVRQLGETSLRTRAEVKNVNSIRFLQQAIEYEAKRQVEVYESGGKVIQETRLYDQASGQTRPMRSKEQAHDYRYFQDPDLPPLELSEEYVQSIREHLPELPDDKKKRFIAEYGLSSYDASALVSEKEIAAYFEAVAKGRDAKAAANWITGSLFAANNAIGISFSANTVSAENLGALIDLTTDNTISTRMAKEVFTLMINTGKSPKDIVAEKGLKQITDEGSIEAAIDEVIEANQEQAAKFKSGNEKVIGWLVGQVMKATNGKANPQMVNQMLRQKLTS